MAIIPIRDVPGAPVQPSGNELILIDNGIAMQKATINDAVTPKATEIADDKIADLNLGTASQSNVEDFATAAQGLLADSAVQPGDLATVATSGDYEDLLNRPTLGSAAAQDVSAFAPAAQAVPTGGTTGQVLAKISNADNDVGWSNAGSGDMPRSVYDPGSLEKNAFDGFPVGTRAELKGLDPDIFTVVQLTEQGREGTFVWRAGDYSVPVAADICEGVYIEADSVAATEGAWVRVFDGPYNIRWFGAIPDQAGVDCHAAIQGAINLIEANEPSSALRYGRALFFPAGQYETSQQITIRDPGIRLIGEGSVTSVIKAQAGITGTAVIFAQPDGDSATLVGHGVIGLGVDCNLQPVHGYWGEVLYDNILFDDFRISAVAGDKHGFYTARKTGHNLNVEQTISIRKLFVSKINQPGTVPAIYIRNCQEILIEESKGWNSNVANSGSDPVWLIEDCRSLTMIQCSAANSKIGIHVHGATRPCIQISIISPLYENVGIPLRTTAVDATVAILNLYHVNPRHQNAGSDGYDLDYTRLGYVETTSSPVVLGANSQTTTVLSSSRTLVTDSGNRNQIRAIRNLVDDFEYFGHNISVWDHANGQALLQTVAPASAETGLLVAVNLSGSITLKKVVVGSPDSAGSGFRVLRVAN